MQKVSENNLLDIKYATTDELVRFFKVYLEGKAHELACIRSVPFLT